MADYPAYLQLVDSQMNYADGITTERSTDGTLRVQSFFTEGKREFELVHELDSTDFASLLSFYETNKLADISLTWGFDGQVYTCKFMAPPKLTPLGGLHAKVSVKLGEV